MKKSLLTIFISLLSFSVSFAQNQKTSVAPDSNSTCAKATKITASYSDSPIFDSFTNKSGNAYYTFVATAKSAKILVTADGYVGTGLENALCQDNLITGPIGRLYVSSLPYGSFNIGENYNFSLSTHTQGYPSTKFKVSVINCKKADDLVSNPTVLLENAPYNFNISDYTKGRDDQFNYDTLCKTSKVYFNTLDIFFKFKATATIQTLVLNLDNANVETIAEMINRDVCNKNYQLGQTQRFYTLTNLTVGTDYTVRVEFGADNPLGYARTAVASTSSIVLKSGTITSVDDVQMNTSFSISPNPTSGSFTFHATSDESVNLEVYNTLGQKVAAQNEVHTNDVISFSLAKGIYLLNISNEQGTRTEKLVIE